METEQIDRRVTWLDEQRRKDAEELTRVEERIELLHQSLRQQATQIRDLAAEAARVSALEARVQQFDESIGKHRGEISQQLEVLEERRTSREKQLESLRLMEQNTIAEELDEIRNELKTLGELQSALEGRRHEELRVSRKLDEYEKTAHKLASEVQSDGRSLVGVREAVRQEGQRLDDLDARVDKLAKRSDEQRGFMDSAQDHLRRLETRTSALEASDKELRRSQSLWTEQQTARLEEFERAWQGWERRFTAFEDQSDELKDRMQAYDETHRELRTLREEAANVVASLERRIVEITEMHRLSEDRSKQAWSKFEADEKKRWSSFRINADEQWKEHLRVHTSMAEDLVGIREHLDRAVLDVDQLKQSNLEHINDMAGLVQEWAAELGGAEASDA